MSDDKPSVKVSGGDVEVTLFPGWFLVTMLLLAWCYVDDLKLWIIDIRTAECVEQR